MDVYFGSVRSRSAPDHGVTSATTVMRKLAAYPRQNNVAMGPAQVGMLEHTRFTLNYLRTESLRRQVQSSLNNGEALNSLARALFFAIQGKPIEAQLLEYRPPLSCSSAASASARRVLPIPPGPVRVSRRTSGRRRRLRAALTSVARPICGVGGVGRLPGRREVAVPAC